MNTDPSALPEAAADVPAAETGETIGRYTRSQLEALRGKRGRKPPEYFQLFPELAKAPAAAKPAGKPGRKPAAAERRPRGERAPRVSSAIIGEHSIDELLSFAGAKGKKPAAFAILVAAGQVLLDRGALRVPAPAPAVAAVPLPALARTLLAAPPALQALVADLLASANVKGGTAKAPKAGRRGRPPGAPAGETGSASAPAKPARRGRPPGVKKAAADGSAADAAPAKSARRGRPPGSRNQAKAEPVATEPVATEPIISPAETVVPDPALADGSAAT